MTQNIIYLSIPGLRATDLDNMPHLKSLADRGGQTPLVPGFPCVTWPVQANALCGCGPAEHGVVANGFYWRESHQVEMWTAWNERIERPQIWDLLHDRGDLTSAAWFPMLSKGCGADTICMPAPIHNPDGSESLWCYTRPKELYGDLRDAHGHFPLQHFWGPAANIKSSAWIADSAVTAATRFQPNFFYIYLPHLDYAAQKTGPDSEAAQTATIDLDRVIGNLISEMNTAYEEDVLWLVASEYTIVPVDHVCYPNRILRAADLLTVRDEQGEWIDLENTPAWALVDHQFSHVFVQNPAHVPRVVELFSGADGIDEVLAGDQRAKYKMDHPRSGEVILISQPHSWQAYYYWLDDDRAPPFARTVDIHRKPGYDPVELHFDPQTGSIPLDASLVKGSHGAPAVSPAQQGILLASKAEILGNKPWHDHQIAKLVVSQFD